jgi:glycosyltransferase involved in cell wall biosynthesis
VRVAIVGPSLDSVGGQSVQARSLQDNLRQDGHDVFFVPIDPRFPGPLRWLRQVPYARTMLNQLLYCASLLRLRAADVVYVFAASYWSFVLAPLPAIAVARLLGRRVLLAYHSGEAADHLNRWGVFVHPWLRMADEIIVPSEYLQGIFGRHGYRSQLVRNVVDTSRFRYRERQPLRPRLLSTRNLEPHYRVEDTLRAFALLRSRVPEATLTIAGTGSQERTLKRLAVELGPVGICFVGNVDPDRVPRLYDDADIYVNASVVDNQPVSVLEAFAAGLMVVSTPTGDIPAMVEYGDAGRLVPPGDPAATVTAVLDLLEHPERSTAMVRRARSRLDEHRWSRVRESWDSVSRVKTA